MKRNIFLTFIICGVFAALPVSVSRAQETNETKLIAILQSPASSLKDKGAACAQLKLIGTGHSVNALAALLTNDKLSHSARYVLESLPGSAAENALIQALPKTTGPMRAGIIISLGMRADPTAVTELGKLLSDTNDMIAVASAEALGQIGGSKSLKLLQNSFPHSTGSLHRAELDGILLCATRMPDAGKRDDALKVYESLYASEKEEGFRQAAFRGILLASGKNQLTRMTNAILTGDAPAQSAALQIAGQCPGPEVTRALAATLPKTSIPVQLALIECLAQRADPVAMPAMVKAVASPDLAVRTAALAALGILGDDSTIALLAGKATPNSGAERAAAQGALVELNRGPITRTILELIRTSSPAVKTELIRALGLRSDADAVPALLDLAQSGDPAERAAALQALALLARSTDVPRIVKLVVTARTDDSRSEAADALNSVFQRILSSGVTLDTTSFVQAIQTGSIETRLALLPICSVIPQAPIRDILHAAMSDSDARIRDAGIHALYDTQDTALIPELLRLAIGTNQPASQLLAIQGCVRLVSQEETAGLSNAAKLDTVKAILAIPLNTREKRLVLSALGAIADDQALALALPFLDDTEVKAEAEQAVVNIAEKISDVPKARAALRKVRDTTTDADTKKSAEAALKKIK